MSHAPTSVEHVDGRLFGAAHAHTRAAVDAAVRTIRARTPGVPEVAIILGTGLGALGAAIEVTQTIPYDEIPGFPLSTVESHHGRLLFGTLGGRRVVAMQGRFHRYEGYSLQQVTFPVRVLRALGAQTLVVSNACGGMHPLWAPGDIMMIADHINLLGDSPLIGANDERFGPRFPDLSACYDAALRALAREVAVAHRVTLREGTYVAVPGPNLETRAEYRMLRQFGADVVGMSTVAEVIAANHMGMRVLGISCVTNHAAGVIDQKLDHTEVLEVGERMKSTLIGLLRDLCRTI